MDLRKAHSDFLFGELGAGLKAKAGLIEFRNLKHKHPNMLDDEVAKMVANLINDDFGGLHLGRLGRNPTVQHIFRLLALAPDWTESNVRTMIKAFKAGSKEETAFYRKFWAGIIAKGVLATALANLAMASMDEDDKSTKGTMQRLMRNYRTAWGEGSKWRDLRWGDIDITPLAKKLGAPDDRRYYFPLLGHFKDPLKFILKPLTSAKHKGSILTGTILNAIEGSDWAGRRYTTAAELLGKDYGKGKYKTTSRKGGYKKGDTKSGKLSGKTVTWDFKGGGPLNWEQIPSFLISRAKGSTPVQVQNLLSWMAGETTGFEAFTNSLGLGVRSKRLKRPTKGTKKTRRKVRYRLKRTR